MSVLTFTPVNASLGTSSSATGAWVSIGCTFPSEAVPERATWSFFMTNAVGDWQFGNGALSQLTTSLYSDTSFTPPACEFFPYTYADRVLLANNQTLLGSGLFNPIGWDVQHVGALSIPIANKSGGFTSLTALCQYQGRLAIFSKTNIQIWTTDADPQQWQRLQQLENIGTNWPESVKGFGELDVFFLNKSGIRALRVRDVNLNAMTDDVGLPIDNLVKTQLAAHNGTRGDVCAIFDPEYNAYWVHVAGKIFVLQQYSSARITAWSSFDTTAFVSSVLTTFYPEKFVLYEGRIYVKASDGYFYEYSTDYDATTASIETSWIDGGQPMQNKQFSSVDVVCEGAWTISATTNPYAPTTYENAYVAGGQTLDVPNMLLSLYGTHIKVKAETSAASRATLSALFFKFDSRDEK